MKSGGGVSQFASLYVGDLHVDVTEAMLYEIFNSVGPVGSIRVCRDSVSRRSLGYAYVNFHAVADAERALDTLNYSSIKGRSCRIGWSQRDPSLRKSGVGNIHVKNLDRNIDNKALYDTFSLFGNILSCKVACSPDGKSRGYGFVHYETEEAAKQAIERVNGMQIGEKTVQVSPFVKSNERNQEPTKFTNLYIKNFPNEWDEEKVSETFTPFGTITSSCVMSDAKGRKFAFVNFEKSEDALACVEAMHDKDLRTDEEKAAAAEGDEYEKLFVQRAQSKAERQAQFRQMRQQETGSNGRAQGVNLYVKNLDESTDDASLRELFEPFGAITSVAAMKDEKGLCKGFGFVAFSSPDEATKAVTEMHLKVVKGKPLYVGLAEKREAREERLRQRYQPGMGGGKGKGGGKGGKGGMMGPNGGGMPPQMYGGGMGNPQMGGMMGMNRPMMGPMGGMMGPMGGMMGPKGPMMGMPQMAQRPMMNPQQMMMAKGGMPGMMPGKGGPAGMPMMGGMPGMMPGMPGMMRPMAPPQQMQGQMRPPQQGGMPQGQMRPPQPAAPAQPMPGAGQTFNASTLAAAPPGVQKQMIGEKLYPMIAKYQPELAGKVTGMMLEMDSSELLMLLESEQQLKAKVDEALRVLQGQ
mmetsp:Transcript_87762/g.160544  ORF Transcript_87762/g.160544 Transcript_87762/m.160544 type:complete len:635 (+) Transcript_87762:171-2075(+)